MSITSSQPQLATGAWTADPIHSSLSFRARHMGIGTVRGTFTVASATLTIGDSGLLDGATVTAAIDATSVNTGEPPRDQHLRSADFLDVDRYPTITFVSCGVSHLIGSTFTLLGDLTLHGVTQRIELAVEHLGVVDDPTGAERTGFHATATISRSAFGVDIQLMFGAGNAVVGDSVGIDLDIEFVNDRNPDAGV